MSLCRCVCSANTTVHHISMMHGRVGRMEDNSTFDPKNVGSYPALHQWIFLIVFFLFAWIRALNGEEEHRGESRFFEEERHLRDGTLSLYIYIRLFPLARTRRRANMKHEIPKVHNFHCSILVGYNRYRSASGLHGHRALCKVCQLLPREQWMEFSNFN